MMTDDDFDKINRMMNQIVKTHIGVMAEDFQHRLGAVADGVLALDEKLDRNTDELKSEIEKSRAEYRGLFAGLDEKIDGVEQRLDAKIDGVAADLKETREELKDELSAGFSVVGEKACLCVDAPVCVRRARTGRRRQVEGHEARIQTLERKAA